MNTFFFQPDRYEPARISLESCWSDGDVILSSTVDWWPSSVCLSPCPAQHPRPHLLVPRDVHSHQINSATLPGVTWPGLCGPSSSSSATLRQLHVESEFMLSRRWKPYQASPSCPKYEPVRSFCKYQTGLFDIWKKKKIVLVAPL